MDVEITPYTFLDSERIRFGRYPVLDTVLYRWTRRLEVTLFDQFKVEVYTGASVFEEMKFSSFYATMQRPRPIYFFEMKPFPDRGLFVTDNRFSAYCLSKMGGDVKGIKSGSRLSPENQVLLQRVVQLLMRDFERSLEDVAKIKLRLKRMTTSPFRSRLFNAYESCLVGQVHLSSSDFSSRLSWCIPRNMLASLLDKIGKQKVIPPALVDRDTGPGLSGDDLLKWTDYKVPVSLGRINKQDMLAGLRVGQVLPLENDSNGNALLEVDGTPRLVASVGEVDGHYAIKVEDKHVPRVKRRTEPGAFKPVQWPDKDER